MEGNDKMLWQVCSWEDWRRGWTIQEMEGATYARVLERSKQQLLGRDSTRWQRCGEPKGLKCCLMGTRGPLKETKDKKD